MSRYNEEVLKNQPKPEKKPERTLPKPGEYTVEELINVKRRPMRR